LVVKRLTIVAAATDRRSSGDFAGRRLGAASVTALLLYSGVFAPDEGR
jgi:hypothetical protein